MNPSEVKKQAMETWTFSTAQPTRAGFSPEQGDAAPPALCGRWHRQARDGISQRKPLLSLTAEKLEMQETSFALVGSEQDTWSFCTFWSVLLSLVASVLRLWDSTTAPKTATVHHRFHILFRPKKWKRLIRLLLSWTKYCVCKPSKNRDTKPEFLQVSLLKHFG